MTSKKRTLEMSDAEVEKAEASLYVKVTEAHGSKMAEVKMAKELATRALSDLERARKIIAGLDQRDLDESFVNSALANFNEKYPPIEVPKAVMNRNRSEFGLPVYRQSKKEKNEVEKHAEQDAEFINRFKRREAAKERFLARSNKLLEECGDGTRTVCQIEIKPALIPTSIQKIRKLYF